MSIETMTKLATATVGVGGSSSIEFTNIPQTYTDLKILLSIKDVSTGTSGASYIDVRLNGSTGTYNVKRLVGFGSSTTTNTAQTSGFMSIGYFGNSRTSMANIFTNAELNFPNYTAPNNKTVSCYFAMADNTTTGPYTGSGSGIWENTSPINSILIRADGVNLAEYSTATLYGIRNVRRAVGNSVKAIGGNISYDGTYVIHTFTSTANFVPQSNINAEYLVVAGGGATYYDGVTDRSWSGGGGAGGYRTNINGTRISLTVGNTYQVTVGAGGARGTTAGKGSNSGIGSVISSTGGGGGPNGNGDTGKTGGSGSGGSGQLNQFTAGGAGNEGGYSPVEGYAGGTGGNGAGNTFGAGGGGSGGVGSNGSVNGAAGGPGTSNSISGSAVTYAAGGKGGNSNGAAFDSAVANTGNGAGYGGNGGSGIVIIRYKG